MYKSDDYSPAQVIDAFVCFSNYSQTFHFIERGSDKRYDIRQGSIPARHLPLDIQKKAKKSSNIWPPYVTVDKELTIKYGVVE